MNLVIAEDEAIIRLDMKEILTAAGHKVIAEARSGQEALRLAKECKPDCVFMDAHMQGDDGIWAATLLGAGMLCPVVMVTAYSSTEKVRQAAEAGVFAYVNKPFSEQDLLNALEVATSRFQQLKTQQDEIDSLKNHIETRALIEKAKAVLMESGLSEQEAFSRLQKTSMNTRTPLKEIAQAVMLVGHIK